MRLTAVHSIPTTDEKAEKVRLRVDPILKAYVGAGGRSNKKPVEPQKGGKAPKDVERAMFHAYQRAIESAAMYEKEESNRFWADDPESFKSAPEPEEPQPEDVKIEVKVQKHKKK
jgi:hypothetical protein